MQDWVHEVAGAVSGEGPASAISTVGSGGESKDEDAGARIAKAGYRPRPIGLVDVGTTAGFSDGGAVGAKAGAELAGDDAFAKEIER